MALGVRAQSPNQSLKILKPTLGSRNDYSKAEQAAWEKALATNAQLEAGKLSYEKLPKGERQRIDQLEDGAGPLTQGPGCSWYCGGQMYKVTASSQLQNKDAYKPDNLHDFSLLTAWVPNTAAGVIGQRISFYFKPLSPRVNQITIYNGYLKNQELYQANARVRKFKLYLNGTYYATLELADTSAAQTFSIAPVRSTVKGKDLVLTLEIQEVYKGDKYPDVAVSEINFSGLDVH
ncbi:hypothetical protein B0919_20405 [Hymenobacter sp. CRA2]|nr:hypothetical protein B0919_20405 [Hymenobacter sp. CRA2]